MDETEDELTALRNSLALARRLADRLTGDSPQRVPSGPAQRCVVCSEATYRLLWLDRLGNREVVTFHEGRRRLDNGKYYGWKPHGAGAIATDPRSATLESCREAVVPICAPCEFGLFVGLSKTAGP